MYALTVKQPWASAIVLGLKRVENRTWRTNYRGPLAIHAGLSIDPEGEEVLATAGVVLPQGCQELPRGAILGVVNLVDMVRYFTGGTCSGPQGRLWPRADPYDLARDPLAFGPWCWILRDSRSLPRPIPCRGQRSLWEITDPAVVRLLGC